MNRSVDDILRQPYSRVLRPAEEGGYTAEILEFPGCVTEGETLEEAFANLEDAARGWLEAVIELGQNVPEPATENEYSGKIVLRLPRSLHRVAASLAERDGVSLNTFLATAIAERVGAVARTTVLTLQMQSTSEAPTSPRVRKVRYDTVKTGGVKAR
jgi:antitoxin HicB